MNHKKFVVSFNFSFNILLIINLLLFIVICNSETEDKDEINSTPIINRTVSPTHKYLQRERRDIRRGQNNYFQKGYDLNRLRYELQSSYKAPRHKPYFHRINEVYSYYLPPKFTKINSNIENFSDKNRLYGTKTRSSVRSRGEERFTLSNRISPLTPPALFRPISRDKPISVDRMGFQSSNRENDRNRYRPQYQNYSPRTDSSRDINSRTGGSQYSGQPFSPSSSGSALIPEPQNLVRNSTFPGIPGWLRLDFPGYSTVPYTGFNCKSQPYYGYYADTNAGCQVFHVCQPDGREYSFLCPNGTLYHQKVQTCDWWYHVDCPSSPRFYYLNARIGVLPPIDATLYRFPKT